MNKKLTPMTFSSFLIHEAGDITALPDKVISELKSNIRKGASDLDQDWTNALELTQAAYRVSNIARPDPDQKGAWNQYMELLKFAVQQLSATRGLDGKWRNSTPIVTEDEEYAGIGNRRFFVEIPPATATEVDAESMDDVIDQITNKLRNHSATVRVEERSETRAVLSVWVDDTKREEITIKEVS